MAASGAIRRSLRLSGANQPPFGRAPGGLHVATLGRGVSVPIRRLPRQSCFLTGSEAQSRVNCRMVAPSRARSVRRVTSAGQGLAPTGLPVEDVIPELRSALGGGTAVLTAEAGAGKTTVVPLRLLDEDWLGDRRIVVLEPRRVAARAAATRMSDLLGEDVGGTVGYATRDERRTGKATRIEVVTEGILTRRLQSDASLPGVGMVVFDEFHERHLQTDLGLAFTLDAREVLRPDLRVMAMSATIATGPIAALLGGAPVVTSAGRTFPVEIRWAPLPAGAPPGFGRGRCGAQQPWPPTRGMCWCSFPAWERSGPSPPPWAIPTASRFCPSTAASRRPSRIGRCGPAPAGESSWPRTWRRPA